MARTLTVTHWGAYEVKTDGERIVAVHPFRDDPDPSPIGQSLQDHDHPLRVRRPSVRKSWLEHGPGAAPVLRGVEPFVEVDWDTALDLVAAEIDRVRKTYGNQAIFAGSYGWASAGRFHHAQSQLRRFFSLIGGATSKRDTYSHAAAEVLIPHVLGYSYEWVQDNHTSWPVIVRNTELFVAFGGVPRKNSQVQAGGQGRHLLSGYLRQCVEAGVRFVNMSPVRDDLPEAEWLPIRPNTDTAMILGLVHELIRQDLVDEDFLDRYTVGWDRLAAYVIGDVDGTPKDPKWAGAICDIEPERISSLANDMASHRTMVNGSWSLQRSDHGEQPYWAIVALGCALGQVGLPGGGFGLGYGAVGSVGNGVTRIPLPSVPRRPNPVSEFIPVARIADMLLDPGGKYTYDGQERTYPKVHMIYWAGGNPFHHHQDLGRLVEAWRIPDTIVVHEPWWTATARRADVVLPVTLTVERDDIGGAPPDDYLIAMRRLVPPYGEARSDFAIFAGLAERLGVADEYTEGRNEEEWIRWLYERIRQRDPAAPPFEEFWEKGVHRQPPTPEAEKVLFADFRAAPEEHPLPTPSGRIELWSEDIARAEPEGCPPHPAWLEPAEWLGNAAPDQLHLISNQPRTRLHSQFDHGRTSESNKIGGREPLRINPDDAAVRGLTDGDVVKVWNDRGATLAGVRIDDGVMRGVVELATGAWFDPVDPSDPDSLDTAGNPNVLTYDRGTSGLAQGPAAMTCLVRVEKWEGPLPERRAIHPPEIIVRT